MSEQPQQTDIEVQWTIRTAQIPKMLLIGVQNSLPQSYEDEQKMFASIDSRKEEIKGRVQDLHTYMVIHDHGSKMTVGLRVDQPDEIPGEMVSLVVPEEEYVIFRFEEKHICLFWEFFCDPENQQKYGVDVGKARFETFNDSLQPNGITEIYFPKM